MNRPHSITADVEIPASQEGVTYELIQDAPEGGGARPVITEGRSPPEGEG